MSDEQEFKRMAIALGMASFQAQSLEYSLVSLFAATFAAEQTVWKPKIQALMETRYKQTLGKLVRDASKELHLTAELTKELEVALQNRNWVTHHFFGEYGAVGLSSSLLSEATQRLEAIWPIFEKTADKVHRLVIEQQMKLGRSEKQVQADIEHALQTYLSENGHA